MPFCILFADVIVLIDETRKKIFAIVENGNFYSNVEKLFNLKDLESVPGKWKIWNHTSAEL